jgi:hypothetical protein
MSWGYFADLRLSLDTAAWDQLLEQRPSAIQLDPGWSGLENKDLEEMFSRPNTGTETFAQILKWKCYTGKEAIETIETNADRTRLRVCLMLDKSLLDLAYPLATLLEAARGVGGEGSLRLVNDGTAVGEDGVELVLARGTISTQPIDDCWSIVEQLGAELFAGMVQQTRQKAKSRAIRNPFTGESIDLTVATTPAAKKAAATGSAATKVPTAKKTAAKKTAAKKTAAEKTAAEKPTLMKTAVKKTTPMKTAVKKPTPKKFAAKKTAAKKTAAKKPAPKKTAAKKPAPKKTAARKTIRR